MREVRSEATDGKVRAERGRGGRKKRNTNDRHSDFDLHPSESVSEENEDDGDAGGDKTEDPLPGDWDHPFAHHGIIPIKFSDGRRHDLNDEQNAHEKQDDGHVE